MRKRVIRTYRNDEFDQKQIGSIATILSNGVYRYLKKRGLLGRQDGGTGARRPQPEPKPAEKSQVKRP